MQMTLNEAIKRVRADAAERYNGKIGVFLAEAAEDFLCDEIERLRAIVEQCSEALNVVAAGIWRDKRSNTCGLTGASAAVHAVEFARKALRATEAVREV